MNIKKITKIFVGMVLVIGIIYDVFAIVKGGTEASISHLLITWAYSYPIMPFAFGVVIGHLFWRMRDGKGTKNLGNIKV